MPKGEEQERAKRDPRIAEVYARERDISYTAPLRVSAKLVIKETGEIKETAEEGIFLGDFPMMTSDGTFMINGAERVVVSQLVRSPGVYFDWVTDPGTGKRLSTAKLIPNRGAWLEFETSNRDILSVKVDRKRKMPVTILLRAIGIETDDAAARHLQGCRHQRGSPLHRVHPRQGADQDARGGADRALSPPAAGRPADARQRDDDARQPLLRTAPLRPRQGWPLQARRAPARRARRDARPGRGEGPPRAVQQRPGCDHQGDDPDQQRHGQARRHRSPRQPPHPRRGRVDPDARPHRLPAPRARYQRAHDDPGPGRTSSRRP